MSMETVNRELQQLTEEYAAGRLGPGEFRERRRALICSVTGQPAPSVAAVAEAGEQTHPGIEPVTAGRAPRRVPYVLLTAFVVLLAATGLAGLLWFILRN